jgi:hypothetical protein
LRGFVEHDGARFAGNILNISGGGFFLHLSSTPTSSLVVYGDSDYGEIQYAGRSVHGFGQIVRIDSVAKGVGIGFSWDVEEIDKSDTLLISEIIQEQITLRQAGFVATTASDVILGGHISSALAADVFSNLKAIGAANARVSLRDCVSIDSSGIEMLMTIRDMAVPIVDVGEEIRAVTKRFHLFTDDAATP